MNKHTPGPWEAFTEDSFSGWWAIRQVETALEVGSGDGGDIEADARLKAAAPELLEAVERLLVCMSLAGWEGDDSAIFARKAIAKVKGEI